MYDLGIIEMKKDILPCSYFVTTSPQKNYYYIFFAVHIKRNWKRRYILEISGLHALICDKSRYVKEIYY